MFMQVFTLKSFNHLKERPTMTFEEYLQDKHAEQYQGLDDEMPDDFTNWLCEELDVDTLIGYAEAWHKGEVEKE